MKIKHLNSVSRADTMTTGRWLRASGTSAPFKSISIYSNDGEPVMLSPRAAREFGQYLIEMADAAEQGDSAPPEGSGA